MSPVAGPLFAAALLVVVAGVAKAARPAPARVALRTAGLPSGSGLVRALGVGEVLLGVAVVVVGGRLGGALVAVAYVGFAAFAAHLARASRRGVPCGCFGSSDAPVGPLHVWIDAALAAVGVAAMAWPTDGVGAVAADTPWAGLPFLCFTLMLTWLLLVALTVLPETLAAAKPGRTRGAVAP